MEGNDKNNKQGLEKAEFQKMYSELQPKEKLAVWRFAFRCWVKQSFARLKKAF